MESCLICVVVYVEQAGSTRTKRYFSIAYERWSKRR